MKTLRRYWETHNGKASPLLHIRDDLRSKSIPLDASDVKNLAEEVGLSEATVRSVISDYDFGNRYNQAHSLHKTPIHPNTLSRFLPPPLIQHI
ncbi:MAG: hypothetical protein WBL95_19200 [Microcoleus sp.]